MARVYLIENNPRSELFYSVDAAVGSGRPNHYDDVLLVQFLLEVRSECGTGHEEYVPPGTGAIAIDGICGSQTIKYIRRFQEIGTLRNPTIPLTQDGVVSPVLAGSGSLDGARTNRFLTIAALNSVYGKIRGKAASRDITHDALFPRELTPYLNWPRSPITLRRSTTWPAAPAKGFRRVPQTRMSGTSSISLPTASMRV